MRVVGAFLSSLIVLSAFSTPTFAATQDRIPAQIEPVATMEVAKSLHPKARPENDEGAVEPSFKLDYVTLLTKPSPTQQKALDTLLAQQQDPKSVNYHKWLTPAQFADRFGLSKNDLNRVTSWLKAQGFQIVSVGGGRNSIVISGTAGQVQSAFGTEIHRYNVNGEEHFANASAVKMPMALSGIVNTVTGLHDFKMHPANSPRDFQRLKNLVHANFFESSIDENFLAPGDLATIYDIGPLYNSSPAIDGTGEKLAVVGQTDIFLADINNFRSGFGLPTFSCTTNTTGTTGLIKSCNTTNFRYVLVGSTDPLTVSVGDIGEADLDVEWSGAMARNAQIIYINGETANGVNDSLLNAISTNIAPVISMSYGICEAEAGDLETQLQEANAQGQTIVNSSGDVGAAGCDFNPPGCTQTSCPAPPFSAAVGGLAVSYPASSPEVTGVGGTEVTIANVSSSTYWNSSNGGNGNSAKQYIPEITWNDDESLGTYCASHSSVSFCDPNPGVPITSAQTFQEDYWLSISGGGASNCFSETNAGVCQGGFPQPSWQNGLTVSGAPAGVRWVPDVALFASPNFPGYIFCTPSDPGGNPPIYTSTCNTGIANAVANNSLIGGTSASAPVFAGILTLMNQYLSASGLGNVNPKLYELAADSSNGAFHPVTTGDNKAFCQSGQPSAQPLALRCPTSGTLTIGFSASNFDATTGYNLVNGLGSVDADKLALAWSQSVAKFTIAAAPGTATVAAGTNNSSNTITVTPINGFTGAVTFSCSGLPNGATCNPASAASPYTTPTTLTIVTSAGTAATTTPATVTVTGTSGGTTATTTISLTVTATTQSFTLTPTNPTLNIVQGQSGNTSIAVNDASGFSSLLSFTCQDPAPESTCSVSPPGLTNTNPVTLSVATTAPITQLQPPLSRASKIFYALLLPGMFGIVLFGSRKPGARGMRLLGLIMVLGMSTLWMASCGGSAGSSMKDPGTAVGSYTITVNASTGGGAPVTSSTTVMVNVTARQ